MLIELIVFGAVGLLLIVVGLLVWKKQKVALLHDYHWKNVRKKDLPAYCRLIGLGLVVMGAGAVLCGLVGVLTHSLKGLWCFAAGRAAGLVPMNQAQKSYNGSWF